MVPRLFAIAFIFCGTSLAWLFLGGTLSARTGAADQRGRERVTSVWGAPQTQLPPIARIEGREEFPAASEVQVDLRLEHRRKGLLWYATYRVAFQGEYEFRNTGTVPFLALNWQFPSAGGIYDDLQFTWNGTQLTPTVSKDGAQLIAPLESGQTGRLRVAYRSQGLDAWRYQFGKDVQALPNFHLRVNTDFREIDFDDNTLAPTAKRETATGWQLDWTYRNLFAGRDIAVVMPVRKQPGPLAAQISYFAPVSLLFFFFVMLMLTTMRGIDLHPMNYFFLACSFFAFHLLMAYLVDHLDIYASFAIAAATSVFLLVSYLRLVTGSRFAMREAAIAQLVYLVLFSAAFFFEGYTGLTVTIGAILTLFVSMQMTAKVQWQGVFKAAPLPTS